MNKYKGFSLIELLIGLMIMGLISTITVKGYTSIQRNAKESALKAIYYQLEVALASYQLMNGSYPVFDHIGIGELEHYLVTQQALDKVHDNPFTRAPFTASDLSGIGHYSYTHTDALYFLEVYGYLNEEVIIQSRE